MIWFEHYLIAAAIFVAIDSIWLTVMSKRFYAKRIGKLLSPKPNLFAAAIFYAIYIAGVNVFVIDPALFEGSLSFAIGRGALLGLAMYATYDLTNQATLKKWPTSLTIVDMLWGTFITGTVSTLTFMILN